MIQAQWSKHIVLQIAFHMWPMGCGFRGVSQVVQACFNPHVIHSSCWEAKWNGADFCHGNLIKYVPSGIPSIHIHSCCGYLFLGRMVGYKSNKYTMRMSCFSKLVPRVEKIKALNKFLSKLMYRVGARPFHTVPRSCFCRKRARPCFWEICFGTTKWGDSARNKSKM